MAFSLPTDPSDYLDDGATTYAPGTGEHVSYGHVGGVPYVFEFGEDPWNGFAVFSATVLDLSSGDELYTLTIEGNTEADFSGAFQDLGHWNMRAINPQDPIPVSNVYDTVTYTYGRLKITTTGTTPQIKVKAFLRNIGAVTPPSLPDALTSSVALSTNISSAIDNLRGWMTTPADGGAEGDGIVPVSDGRGNATLEPSLPKVKADAIAGSFANTLPAVIAQKDLILTGELNALSLEERLTAIYVDAYGARPSPRPSGDGEVSDDPFDAGPGIQAAIDANEARGGGVVVFSSGAYYYSSIKILVDPTKTTLVGLSCTLDWSIKTFIDPASFPELAPWGDFGADSGVAGTLDHTNKWIITDDQIQIMAPTPNLLPDPLYQAAALAYSIDSTGVAGTASWGVTTTTHGATALKPIEYISAGSTSGGTDAFGSSTTKREDLSDNISFVAEEYARYVIGVELVDTVGNATRIDPGVEFFNAAGTSLGSGFQWVGPYDTDFAGFRAIIVDSPGGTAFARHKVTAYKATGTTGAASVYFRNRYMRRISIGANFFLDPGYCDPSNDNGNYGDYGWLIPEMVSGKQYKITGDIITLDRAGTQKYLTIAVRNGEDNDGNRVGVGYGPGILKTYVEAQSFIWDLTAPDGLNDSGGWFTIQTNNTAILKNVKIREVPDNTCLQLKTPEGGTQFNHGHHYMHGFKLVGSYPDADFVDVIRHHTDAIGRSSRYTFYNLQIWACNNAEVYARQAYLSGHFQCSYIANGHAILCLDDQQDAGENISYTSCILSGGISAIKNGSMELRFVTCSIDYCPRFFVGGGEATFVDCHFETGRALSADQYFFEIYPGGLVILQGGKIQIAGEGSDLPLMCDYFVYLHNKYSRCIWDKVAVYNVRGKKAIAGGEGKFSMSQTVGGDSKLMTPALKYDARHNLFGEGGTFETSKIAIMCWMVGGDVRRGRYDIGYSYLPGSSIKCELSTDSPYQGTKSLKVSKTSVGPNNEGTLVIAVPIRHSAIIAAEFRFQTPNDLGGTPVAGVNPKAGLYFQANYGRLVESDIPGVPDVWDLDFCGDYIAAIDQVEGDLTHHKVVFTNVRTDLSIRNDGTATENHTHLLLTCNLVSQPSGFDMYIDDLWAWCM